MYLEFGPENLNWIYGRSSNMLGRSDVRCTAKGNRGAEGEDAALGGDIIPLIDRDVYYAASEMQLLENGIRKFNGNLTVVIGADNNSTSS